MPSSLSTLNNKLRPVSTVSLKTYKHVKSSLACRIRSIVVLELLLGTRKTAQSARYVHNDLPMSLFKSRAECLQNQSWAKNIYFECVQEILGLESKWRIVAQSLFENEDTIGFGTMLDNLHLRY